MGKVGKMLLDCGWLAARSTEVAATGVQLTTTHPPAAAAVDPWMEASVPGTSAIFHVIVVSKDGIQWSPCSISTVPDMLVWTPNASGLFTSCSYGHIIRPTLHTFKWHKVIWNKHIPFNIAAHTWRVWHHGFPTDDRIRRMKISFPSKCFCCFQPKEETLLHLFLHSDLAQGLWNPLADLLHFNRPVCNSVSDLFESWLQGITATNQAGFLRAAAFMCALKQIWFYRNKIKHEGIKLQPYKIFKEVLSYLTTWHHRFQPSTYSSSCVHDIISAAGIKIKLPPTKLVRWIKWQPPKLGLKLNTDGSLVDGRITGGGIVRDDKGGFIFAYHQGFGFGSNLMAEAHALLLGLHLCIERSLPIKEVEVDSQILADIIRGNTKTPWHVAYITRDITQLLSSLGLVIHHVLREANSAADSLATLAQNSSTRTLYLQEEYLPPSTCAALDRDKSGKTTMRVG